MGKIYLTKTKTEATQSPTILDAAFLFAGKAGDPRDYKWSIQANTGAGTWDVAFLGARGEYADYQTGRTDEQVVETRNDEAFAAARITWTGTSGVGSVTVDLEERG